MVIRNLFGPLTYCPKARGSLPRLAADRDQRRVNHRPEPHRHDHCVPGLLPSRLRNRLVMQQRRIDVHKWDARETADQRNELVQIAGAGYGDQAAHEGRADAKAVLVPLGGAGPLARGLLAEERGLEDAGGGEELDRGTDEDGHGVEELDGVDEGAGLRVVADDLDGGIGAEGGVAEGANGGEDDGDDDHDEVEELGEVLWVLHGGLDGQEEANAFESEDRGADGEGPGRGVEELDGGVHAGAGEGRDVIVPDVDQADEDEDVGEHGEGAEAGDVADQGQGHEDDDLQAYECDDAERVGMARSDGVEKGEEVFGGEDHAGADEADL